MFNQPQSSLGESSGGVRAYTVAYLAFITV